MRLLQCVLAFSVSIAGLIAAHRANACQQAGCDPYAWICSSQAPSGHPWAKGWSDDREHASQIAYSGCTRRPGGQACSKPECTHGSAGAAEAALDKQRAERQRAQENRNPYANMDVLRQRAKEREAAQAKADAAARKAAKKDPFADAPMTLRADEVAKISGAPPAAPQTHWPLAQPVNPPNHPVPSPVQVEQSNSWSNQPGGPIGGGR
jgi:hypothetical protein